jgi:hypothetical protein
MAVMCGPDSSGAGKRPIADFCEQRNEILVSIKYIKYLE